MNRRERFLAEMRENLLLPYEASHVYEEEIIGLFENPTEAGCFERFLAAVGDGALILDLACGDGRHTLQLSEQARLVIALDLSPRQLELARRKGQERPGIGLLRASALEPPFPSGCFDGVWFSQAFEYIPPERREEFLAAVRRLLRPAGLLYMSVESWMYPNPWISLKELWSDFRLFCYWRFLRGKPLRWGEFLYRLPPGDVRSRATGWHYHVHTDRPTLCRLLDQCGLQLEVLEMSGGYIYVLCRKGAG